MIEYLNLFSRMRGLENPFKLKLIAGSSMEVTSDVDRKASSIECNVRPFISQPL